MIRYFRSEAKRRTRAKKETCTPDKSNPMNRRGSCSDVSQSCDTITPQIYAHGYRRLTHEELRPVCEPVEYVECIDAIFRHHARIIFDSVNHCSVTKDKQTMVETCTRNESTPRNLQGSCSDVGQICDTYTIQGVYA